jgi:hypothetical protein
VTRRTVTLLLPIGLAGCLHVDWESRRDGTPVPVVEAVRLSPGKTTMKETLERLGPPNLALRAGDVDRFYYVSWDTHRAKFDVSAPVPVTSRGMSLDVFILSLGAEELRLARLDFDRAGVLKLLQAVDYGASNNNQSFALDDRIVTNFLEDRSRSLGIVENDEDDEDER